MLRSMFSAISGLKAHQTKLDTVGNNIANVNTVGFKSSQTVFQDTLSQVLSNGSAATETTGGTNPAQVGLGVQVAGITTNFSQGSTQSTSRSTDFMISGDGFFVTQTGNGEQQYTRAGSFDFDSKGRLVTSNGAILQGWTAANGKVDPNGAIGDLSIPYGSVMAPKASTTGAFSGNLSSAAPVDTEVESQITLYDALGNPQQVTATYKKTDTDTWDVTLKDAGENELATGTHGVRPDHRGADRRRHADLHPQRQQQLDQGRHRRPEHDDAVQLREQHQVRRHGRLRLRLPPVVLAELGRHDRRRLLQRPARGHRQARPGHLRQPQRAGEGRGLLLPGRQQLGCGDHRRRRRGGAGTLTAGALEMSNVDLASEFTDLIIAQRGFQANSRVITASDEILQSLVQLGK